MMARLARYGFDTTVFVFAGRTAMVACAAFFIAWALGLEHPQWAGMSVWAASQPLRGQLLEKSFFRFAGTVIGTVAGIGLVLAMAVHPALMVAGLALWVGLCTGIGNLQRGLVAYGTVLAGYTAAMVSLLDAAHPEHVVALGADRMATVLTGVLVATVVGFAFAPPSDGSGLKRRVCGFLADLLDHLASPETQTTRGDGRALLVEISAIEDGLDPHAAGSIRSRQAVRAARSLLIAAMPLLFRRQSPDQGVIPISIADRLRDAAGALRDGRMSDAGDRLKQAAEAAGPDTMLTETLLSLRSALAAWAQVGDTGALASQGAVLPVVLHRDWVGAREAMIRATGSILLLGAFWQLTGWDVVGFMALGLSVMVSLFSTFENPARMMRNVFLAQGFGVLGALACRWLAWPLAGSELQMILLTMPFILIGPFLMGHRRTAMVSFDYNMVLLLLLHPHWPLTGSVTESLAMGGAILVAPLMAMAVYRYIFPVSRSRRIGWLTQAMLHDLTALAANPDSLRHRLVWQARLYHRTFRLARLSAQSSQNSGEALDAGIALLNLGQAVMRCHALQARSDTPPTVRRAIRSALSRVASLAARPDRAAKAMARLSRYLGGEDGRLMQTASIDIRGRSYQIG